MKQEVSLTSINTSLSTRKCSAASKEIKAAMQRLTFSETYSGLLSLFGSTFGIGSLGLTAMMARVGIITWFMLFLLALVINLVSFNALIHLAEKTGLKHFVDIAQLLGGRKIRLLIVTLFLALNLGSILSTMAMYNNILCSIFAKMHFTNPLLIQSESLIWMIVPGTLLLPVLVKRKLKDMAFVTVLSMFSVFYTIGFLAVTLLNSDHQQTNHRSLDSAEVQIKLFSLGIFVPSVFGYLIGTVNCGANMITIYNELPNRSIANMKRLLTIHSVFFIIAYSCFSLLGYLIFHNNKSVEKESLLFHFLASKNVYTIILDILMMVTALNSFIYSFKPVKDTLIHIFDSDLQNEGGKEDDDFDPLNVAITVSLFIICCFVSGMLTFSDVGFMKITEVINSVLIPVIFIMLPLIASYRLRSSRVIGLALLVTTFFYLWNMKTFAAKFF